MTSPATEDDLLRELFDVARDSMLALDEEGVVVLANEAAGAALGVSKRYLVGKAFVDFVPLEERRAFRSALQALAPGESSALPLLPDAHGEAATALVRKMNETDPPRFAVRLADTGREIAAPSPRIGESVAEELDSFFRWFPFAVVGVDRSQRLVFANAHAQETLGRDLLRINAPFDDGPAEGRLRALSEQLVSRVTPVSRMFVELHSGKRLRVSGVPARGDAPSVLIFEDVTDETRLDEVTRDFLRNASHQLRTPLTGIAAAVQVLQAGAKENPFDRDRFLDHVERHTTRLARLARSLLVLARAQSGETVRLERTEIRSVLEALVGETHAPRGVVLEIDCETGLTALCDGDLLYEAVSALLDNALEHTSTGRIDLRAEADAAGVLLEIRDTGTGIEPEHRGRLFEPFYRPAANGEGFGLGLSIAAQAIEAMHGELAIGESEHGSGTAFTIRLPTTRTTS